MLGRRSRTPFAALVLVLVPGCSLIAPLSELRRSDNQDGGIPDGAPDALAMADVATTPTPSDGGSRLCTTIDAALCDDFDVPDGGFSRWMDIQTENGGSVAIDLGGGARSQPGSLTAAVGQSGNPQSPGIATLRKFLPPRSAVRFSSQVHLRRRPSVGVTQTHKIYGSGVVWGVFIEVDADGTDRLVEEYYANNAYQSNEVVCSGVLGSKWSEVTTVIDLVAGTAEAFYDGVQVASLALVAVPATTMVLRISVGIPWTTLASGSPAIDVDDVVVQ
jgi:uncharacterized membrane protein